MALLVINFTRPPEIEPRTAYEQTHATRLEIFEERSTVPRSSFEKLCRAAGVKFTTTPFACCGKTLEQLWQLGVPVDRLKPDRALTLCPQDGPCFDEWKGTYNADGQTKRQPRGHKLSCAYKQLQLLQAFSAKNPNWGKGKK